MQTTSTRYPSAVLVERTVRRMTDGSNVMINHHHLGMATLLADRRPLTLQGIIPSEGRAVFFGEDHSRRSIKDFVVRNLPFFVDNGFKFLGLESLCSDLWPYVFDFNNGDNPSQIEGHMSRRNCFRYCPEAYLRLMAEARGYGLKVVPLDLPLDRQLESSNSGRTANFKRAERDLWMARTASDFLKTGGRMVSLVGYEHLSLRHSLPGFLNRLHRVEVASVMLVGGMISGGTGVESAVRNVGLTQEEFVVPFKPEFLDGEQMVVWREDRYELRREGRLTDWIVHLAETEPNCSTELLAWHRI